MTGIASSASSNHNVSWGHAAAVGGIAGGVVAVATGAPRLALNRAMQSPRAATQIGVIRAVTRALPIAAGVAITDRVIHSDMSKGQKQGAVLATAVGAGLVTSALMHDVGFARAAGAKGSLIGSMAGVLASLTLSCAAVAGTVLLDRPDH